MYFDVSESTLATREVNDGRPSDPGAGCITSAPSLHPQIKEKKKRKNNYYIPIIIVGLAGSVRYRTDAGSGIVLMPPSLTLILYGDIQLGTSEATGMEN